MVSVSNGSLSGDISNKRHLGYGCKPKYKPRKLSANRKFPPGCGPNAVPINVRPEGNRSSNAGSTDTLVMTNYVVAKGVGTSAVAATVGSEAVGNSDIKVAKLGAVPDSEIQNAVDPNSIVGCHSREEAGSSSSLTSGHWDGVNGSMDVHVTETLDKLMGTAKENVTESKTLIMEIGPLGTQLQAKLHRQEGVDNPIEIERDKQLHTYTGKVETTVVNGLTDKVQEVMPESNLFKVDIVNDMEILNQSGDQMLSEGFKEDSHLDSLKNSGFEVVRSPLIGETSTGKDLFLGTPMDFSKYCGSIQPETSIRPKDKFHPRRISAIREFPPYCGINVSLPIEENEMSPPGKDSLNRTDKVESPEPSMSDAVSEREIRGKMSATSGEYLDQLHNIHVEIEKSELLKDGSGIGLLGEIAVTTAEGSPMEFDEYSSDLQHGINERTGESPESGTMSKTLVNTSIKDAKKPVGKDLKRELVHGLMAAPYCLWRNSKTADNPDGLKKRQQNVPLQGKQKPKADALNSNLKANSSEFSSLEKTASPDLHDETPDEPTPTDEGDHDACNECVTQATPISMFKAEVDSSDNDFSESVAKDVVVYSPGDGDEGPNSHDPTGSKNDMDREMVHGLMAAANCPWRKEKTITNSNGGISGGKKRKQNFSWRQKAKAVATKSTPLTSLASSFKKKNKVHISNHVDKGTDDNDDHDRNLSWRQKSKAVARKSNPGRQSLGSSSKKKNTVCISSVVDDEPDALMLADDEDRDHDGKLSKQQKAKAVARKSNPVRQSRGSSSKKKNTVHISNDVDEGPDALKQKGFEITLPPFAPNTSDLGDARNRVRRILQLFHAICRKFLQQEEANLIQGNAGRSQQSGKKARRIDLLTAEQLKKKGEVVNTTKMIGPVPGVEVGDEFQYRVELAVVGIHFPYQSGIDSVKVNDVPLATSIVASGAYSDDVENADVLRYSGQGGNVIGKSKQPEDQKLERGNLALKNCIAAKTPVRVVRGWKESKFVDPLDTKPKLVATYVYDGLYTVTKCSTEEGSHGKLVFMFELMRNPGQPELAWKELKKSSKSKIRPGVCVSDISEGKERLHISAVNTLDDDKPPPFNYTAKMIYPDWYSPSPPEGCNCTGRCSKFRKCRCALKNEGDIPYNNNGALVETKPLVYECGPHCKCPPSCYNRVTQRGIKLQLEVFKTDSRGWGVRALTSIPSGSFICEYSGELLEEKDAEERVGNDEYLFDIGQNLIDSATKGEEQEGEGRAEKGYTIDAKTFGNVGRFINHSCLPNLHAQNVIYDNDDERMPHIMLFAMENIPPLTELTYHYNYSLGQIHDSDGNVKVKKCYCGAAGCSGRMY